MRTETHGGACVPESRNSWILTAAQRGSLCRAGAGVTHASGHDDTYTHALEATGTSPTVGRGRGQNEVEGEPRTLG